MSVDANWQQKTPSERESAKKFLRKRFEGLISEEILFEFVEVISQEYVRRIKINVLEEREGRIKFSCNLSPEEMRERQGEVRLQLPPTRLGDDGMYNVVLQTKYARYNESFMPKRIEDEKWIYFAFP